MYVGMVYLHVFVCASLGRKSLVDQMTQTELQLAFPEGHFPPEIKGGGLNVYAGLIGTA